MSFSLAKIIVINGQLIEIIIIIRREIDDKICIWHPSCTVDIKFLYIFQNTFVSVTVLGWTTLQFDDKIRWTFSEEKSREFGVLC